MKTNSGLSAYCHGNADFANVWERCWPPARSLYTKGLPPLCDVLYMLCTCTCVCYSSTITRSNVWDLYSWHKLWPCGFHIIEAVKFHEFQVKTIALTGVLRDQIALCIRVVDKVCSQEFSLGSPELWLLCSSRMSSRTEKVLR